MPRTTRSLIVLALSLAACSGGASPQAEVVPEQHATPPPTTTTTAATAETPPAVPAEAPPTAPVVPEVVPPERTYSVVTIPEDVHLDTLRTRAVTRTLPEDESVYGEVSLSWQTAAHPDPAVATAINAWAEQSALALSSFGDESPTCQLRLATSSVLSMICTAMSYADRGGGMTETRVHTARIVEGRVVPFEMSEALVPKRSVMQAALERCQRQQTRHLGDEGTEFYGDACSVQNARPMPLPTGLGVVFAYDGSEMDALMVRLPWSELGNVIRADGPLGALFPGAATHEVTISGDEQLAAHLEMHCGLSFGVTAAMPVQELARIARGLSQSELAATRVALEGERATLVRSVCARDAEAARAAAQAAATLAARLGHRAELRDAPSSVQLAWVRAQRGIVLRDRGARDGAFLASIPEGALLLATLGDLGGVSSQTGYQGTWARVYPADSRAGWSAGRYLSPWRPAVASAATLLGTLPEATRSAAAASAIVGSLDPSPTRPLWYVAASAEGTTYVGVADGAGDSGMPSAPPTLSTAPGTLDELRFVRTAEDARTAYVLVATSIVGSAPGVMRWHLFAPGAAQAGWTLDAPTGIEAPEDARAELETDETRAGHRWIAEFRMPDRSVVRVRAGDAGAFVEARAAR